MSKKHESRQEPKNTFHALKYQYATCINIFLTIIDKDISCLAVFNFKSAHTFREHSQTLVRRAWCKKKKCEHFSGPPFRPQKISGPSFLPWKLWVSPIEKHVSSVLTGKFVVIFFQGSKIWRATLFTSVPPKQVFVNGPLTELYSCKEIGSRLPS